MERIRIGNNIAISWAVYDLNGRIHNLEGKDIQLYMAVGGYKVYVNSYTIQGNVISWVFLGSEQTKTGDYKLVLEETDPLSGASAFDVRAAFRLTPEDVVGPDIVVGPANVSVQSVLTYSNLVGVESIDVVESSEDSGDNIVTIHLIDGSFAEVVIKNGSKGPKGDKGDTGATGPKGEKGDTGERGPVGVDTVNAVIGTNDPSQAPSVDKDLTEGVLSLTFNNIKGQKGDKGDQGNTGSSVDYPYELVNNVTTDDATKGLSAAQGVVLDGKIGQLGQEVAQLPIRQVGYWSNSQNKYVTVFGESLFIPCSVYKKILIKGQVGSGAANSEYAYVKDFNSSGVTFVDGVSGTTMVGPTENYNTNVPQDAKYLMLLSKTTEDTSRLPLAVIGDGQRNLYKGFVEDMIPTRLVPSVAYANDVGYGFNGTTNILSWQSISILMPDTSLVNIDSYSTAFNDGVLVYRYTTDSVVTLNSASQIEVGDIILLQRRNNILVGGLLLPYIKKPFIIAATNIKFNGSSVSWDSLSIQDSDGTVTSVGVDTYTMSSGYPILVYNGNSRRVFQRNSFATTSNRDILLLYYRDGDFVSGELLGYSKKNPIIAAANNVTYSNDNLSWSSISLKMDDGSVVELSAANYNMGTGYPILVFRKRTNSVVALQIFAQLQKEDILLAYYRKNYGIVCGELVGYILKDSTRYEVHKNDITLNITKRIRQLKNIKWTPLFTITAGEGVHPAGEEVTGIPYSSVKEYLKFVGIDVSIHTFMTTIHDPHSLMYSEGPMANNSRSAYGITYHGVNSLCYFGNVCSALVTTALGRKVQDNSWEYKTMFERYKVLKNQGVESLRVGDVVAMNGHCAIISNIVRNDDGSTELVYVSEQSAPIITTEYPVWSFNNRLFTNKDKLCRYDYLDQDTSYKPSTFVLENNENLYNIGDLVFVDGVSLRTYYRCIIPNRDSEFIFSKWEAVPQYVPNNEYQIGQYASVGDKLYRANTDVQSATFNPSDWVEIHNVFEWAAYPYVYNDDIITFAGDRAAFHTNDLIYINYQKGGYTQMQIFKDGSLLETLNLSSDSSVYQVNVSEYCATPGMYKARLTDGTNYSRYTYFEVIDTTFSVTYQNDVADMRFNSSNGKPLEFQITEQSGYPIAHDAFTEKEIASGKILVNPMALLYVLRHVYWGRYDENTPDMYARVVYSGEYGNVVNEMVNIGTVNAFEGEIIYPDKPNDLGTINGNKNVILAGRTADKSYSFSFIAGASTIVSIIPAIGNVVWTENPPTCTQGKTYLFQVVNGIGKCTEV